MGDAPHAAPAVLAIFARTYFAIALDRVPGLKLNRTGIALLGVIAIIIFSGLATTSVIGFINWPTVLATRRLASDSKSVQYLQSEPRNYAGATQ